MTATVVVVAQRKGGAGKTTLAAHLAVAWMAMGHAVSLIDTDPQASLGRWHQRREARLGGRTGLGFAAATGWRAPGEIDRRARDGDILLVDSPASADAEVRTVMGRAGLVLVPVQPSPVDVWATLPTLEMARRERVPALLILNRVPARAALTAAMRERLADYDAGLATTGIGNRVALAAAFDEGWGVAECAPGSAAAEEIAALAAELLELLPSSERAQPQPGATMPPPPPDRWETRPQTPPRLGDTATREVLTKGLEELPDDIAMPTSDQLLAGAASLKRLLTRRAK